MMRYFSHSLISLTLVAGLFAPFVTILVAPREAFATSHTQIRVLQGSALGNAGAGGNPVSWSQAAAGGAVGIGGCLAAGGISIGGGLSALGSLFGLGGATGGILPGNTPTSIIDNMISGQGVGVNPVPVEDRELIAIGKISLTLQGAQLVNIAAMHNKEAVLDCIAWALAKLIWQAVAASVIDWINSGFNGRPAFVQNLGRFLTGVADEAIGSIIESDSALSFLCSPFQLQIRIALATAYSRRAPSCTLTQVVGNIQNFMNDFTQGGWPAWIQFTSVPQNNPFGGLLMAQATISLTVASRQYIQSEQLRFGSGFLSQTKQVCDASGCRDIIVTPGQLIAQKAQETIGGGQTQLLLADELDEIVSALVSQLLTQALGSFFGLSQPTGYQDDYYRFNTFTDELLGGGTSTPQTGGIEGSGDVINQIDQGIQTEFTFQNLNTRAIGIIESAQFNVQNLVSCWSNKASATSTTGLADPGDRAQAQIEAGTASFTNTALNQRKQPYIDAIVRSNSNITLMEGLVEDAVLVETQAELDVVLRDYYSARSSNSFANQGGIGVLEASLTQLQLEMDSVDVTTQSNLERCTYFPFPPPSSSFDETL